ncbi:MAG: putative SAM-dependent methyltransferase [Herminiimonas sp.]|nr:putative SAM-dependent methyltransferase [Herminiimonas sp.]
MSHQSWLRRAGRWLRNRMPIGGRLSYSQEGEDMVLARMLGEKSSPGFFVDIGAHHPVRYSNTYYFYRRGWTGLNVDALPGTANLFRRMRPKDTTIECGIGKEAGSMTYFSFNEPALNTFSEQEAARKNHPPYHVIDKIQLPVMTLAQLLDRHLPEGTDIDFMTVDTEGLDHEVIASNDWTRYRPKIILVELLNTGLEDLAGNPTVHLLQRFDYRIFAKTYNTFFFVAKESVY